METEAQHHEFFTIARSRADLVAAWRDPAQMTRFPADGDVAWEAESADDPTSSTLSWRSVEGAPMRHDGKIIFKEVPGRGTVIGLSLRYDATADDSAPKVATVIGKTPAKKIREEMRRFKQLMETGEIPSIEGQPSGRTPEEEKEKA